MDNRAIKRYLIVDVFESQYEYKAGRSRPEKVGSAHTIASCPANSCPDALGQGRKVWNALHNISARFLV